MNANKAAASVISKYKAVIHREEVQGSATWTPPLTRRVDADGNVEFLTIRVRMHVGDSERDFKAKYAGSLLTARQICESIAAKEDMSPVEAQMFGLWLVSTDLELQLQPKVDVHQVVRSWPHLMLKYTHIPEAENPAHEVNNHYFLYRREATLTINEERNLVGDRSLQFLYGQARWNYISGRYLGGFIDCVTLAAFQLQSANGDFNPSKMMPGYLTSERLAIYVPAYLLTKTKIAEWEQRIYAVYQSLSGMDARSATQG